MGTKTKSLSNYLFVELQFINPLFFLVYKNKYVVSEFTILTKLINLGRREL